MVWARRNQLRVSAFVTYTDSETWAGNIHPAQALRQYRHEFLGNAKAVVVGMTSNGFTLADRNYRGMLDVVGFDTSVPAVGSDFVRGWRTVQGRQQANNAGGGEIFRPLIGFYAELALSKQRRLCFLHAGSRNTA
jgi:hypothetical protein